jgi:anthranilate phosphoribosyltransferase
MSDDVIGACLAQLVEGRSLDQSKARSLMDRLMEGAATDAQIGAVLAALRLKGETVDEISGMVMSMRDHATAVTLPAGCVDTCGTGGDSSGTFNISTAAAIVVAGCGVPVAKHGNRAQSSRCGSADVLEALGVVIALKPEGVRRCVAEAGIGFLYAPAFHPAMRHVGTARRELGFRTVFNILGPLANPARVRHQALGVAAPAMAPLMAGVLHRLGHHKALVFTGPDGIDELVLHAPAQAWMVSESGVEETCIDPAALGLASAPLSELAGGDAAANAARIVAILEGETGARRDVVLLNAAAALVAAGAAADLAAGLVSAAGALDSGAARDRLAALVRVSKAAA